MNEILKVNHIDDFPLQGVYPESIVDKIKKERATKNQSIESWLDLKRDDNRETANFVCREFEITGMRDDYGNFLEKVNQVVNTKRETAQLFTTLNGNPLGLNFIDKLNIDMLNDKTVREAFIAWSKKLPETCTGIEAIDDCICMAYNAILKDKKIHPNEAWGHAFDLITLNDKNHSSKVFGTYKHIWASLRQTTNEVDWVDKWFDLIGYPRNVSEAQLGQLHTFLLQNMKNTIYKLTDAKIIGPMLRDKSSILDILKSYSDRTIDNMEYLRWTDNDTVLDEILNYLLSYYSRVIQFISDTSCFDRVDQDTFAIKQLIEDFILLHKKSVLRISALDAIDKKGKLSIYIVDKFLSRQLNDNIKRDSGVMKEERDVKERALQIYENILKDEHNPHTRDHIERKLADCILDDKEDYQIRNYAIDIVCSTRPPEIAFEKIKGMLENVIESEESANVITRHCPTCGQTITDRMVQERVLEIYENILKDDNYPQWKEHIEKNFETLILDADEGADTRKHALCIVCRTRLKENALYKAKGFLVKIIENQGRKWAAKIQ